MLKLQHSLYWSLLWKGGRAKQLCSCWAKIKENVSKTNIKYVIIMGMEMKTSGLY